MEEIILDTVKKNNYTEFKGDELSSIAMGQYFMYKYGNCFTSNINLLYDVTKKKIRPYTIDTNITIEDYDVNLLDGSNFEIEFKKYAKDINLEYIIIHIGLSFGKNFYGHSNVLIYSIKNNTFELFEPHGIFNYDYFGLNSEQVYLFLKQWLYTRISFNKFTVNNTKPLFQLNEIGEYAGDPGGFCRAWSIWYIDLLLSNINIPNEELIRYAEDKLNQHGFKQFIGDYSSFITIIKKVVINCNNKCENLNDIFFTIALQFYKLLRLDILITKKDSKDKIKNTLLKIVNCISVDQLLYLCEIVSNEDYCGTLKLNKNNYSIRKALKIVIQNKESRLELYNIYNKLVNKYYLHKYNTFSVPSGMSYYVPYNIKIIKNLHNLLYNTTDFQISMQSRLTTCLKVYKILANNIESNYIEKYNEKCIDIIQNLALLLSHDDFNLIFKVGNSYFDKVLKFMRVVNYEYAANNIERINAYIILFSKKILKTIIDTHVYHLLHLHNFNKLPLNYRYVVKDCIYNLLPNDKKRHFQNILNIPNIIDRYNNINNEIKNVDIYVLQKCIINKLLE